MRPFPLPIIIVCLGLMVGCSSPIEVNSSLGVLQLALSEEITSTTDTVEIYIHHENGEEEHRELPLEDELFIALEPDSAPIDLKLIFHRSNQAVWLGELQQVSPLSPGEVRQEPMVVDPAGTLVVDIPEALDLNASGDGAESFEIIRIHALAENPPPQTPSSFDMVREGAENTAVAIVPAGLYLINISAVRGENEIDLVSPPIDLLQGTTLTYTGVDLCHPLTPGIPCRQNNDEMPTYESALAWTTNGVYVARIGLNADASQALLISRHKEDNRFRGEETVLASGPEFHSLSMAIKESNVYVGVTELNGTLSLLEVHPELGATPIIPSEEVLNELDPTCRNFTSPQHQFEISLAHDGKIALFWQTQPTILDWVPEPDKLGPLCFLMYQPETQEWTASPIFAKQSMNPSLTFNGEHLLASWETLDWNDPDGVRVVSAFNLTAANRPRVLARIQKACPNGTNLPYALDLDNKSGIGLMSVDCNDESILSEVHLRYYSPEGTEVNAWGSGYPDTPEPSAPGKFNLRWTGSTFEGAFVYLNEQGHTQIGLVDLLDMDGNRNPQPGTPWTEVEDRNSLAITRRIPGMSNMKHLIYKKNPASTPGDGLIGLSYIIAEGEGDDWGRAYLTFEMDRP